MNENKVILWSLAIAVIALLLMVGAESMAKATAVIDRPTADNVLASIHAGDL